MKRLAQQAHLAIDRSLAIAPLCGEAHKARYLLAPPAGHFARGEAPLADVCRSSPRNGEVRWALFLHGLAVGWVREAAFVLMWLCLAFAFVRVLAAAVFQLFRRSKGYEAPSLVRDIFSLVVYTVVVAFVLKQSYPDLSLTALRKDDLGRDADPMPGSPTPVGVGRGGTLSKEPGGDPFTPNDRSVCETERMALAMMDDDQYFKTIYGDANRANVSFYTIDPRGLVAFDAPIG